MLEVLCVYVDEIEPLLEDPLITTPLSLQKRKHWDLQEILQDLTSRLLVKQPLEASAKTWTEKNCCEDDSYDWLSFIWNICLLNREHTWITCLTNVLWCAFLKLPECGRYWAYQTLEFRNRILCRTFYITRKMSLKFCGFDLIWMESVVNFSNELEMWIFVWGVTGPKLGQKTQQEFNCERTERTSLPSSCQPKHILLTM